MHTKAQKQKLKRFLRIKEIVILSLVAISFGLLAYEHFSNPTSEIVYWIDLFDTFIALIFIAEFVFEWHHARDRQKYVRHYWFYLLAAVPLSLPVFEYLRAIRIIRLFKLLQIFAHLRYEENTRLFGR